MQDLKMLVCRWMRGGAHVWQGKELERQFAVESLQLKERAGAGPDGIGAGPRVDGRTG